MPFTEICRCIVQFSITELDPLGVADAGKRLKFVTFYTFPAGCKVAVNTLFGTFSSSEWLLVNALLAQVCN